MIWPVFLPAASEKEQPDWVRLDLTNQKERSQYVCFIICDRVMLKYAGEYCEVGDAACRSCLADAGMT